MVETTIYEQDQLNFLHLKRKYGQRILEEVKVQLVFCQHQKYDWKFIELEETSTTHAFGILTKDCCWIFRVSKRDPNDIEQFFLSKRDIEILKRQNLVLNSIQK